MADISRPSLKSVTYLLDGPPHTRRMESQQPTNLLNIFPTSKMIHAICRFPHYKDTLIVPRMFAKRVKKTSLAMRSDFGAIFERISIDFDAALDCFSDLPTDGDHPQLASIRERLEVLERTFKSELNKLARGAEWSCLTVAMFGDTNAGKSTLIESLVCLFAPKTGIATGESVGTGQADYTKQNRLHAMQFNGASFQLLDMPGIEGHETLYGNVIEEAVRKAHVLIFVNGSGKKPEQGTLKRIAKYVRDDAVLHMVLNHRGQPSAYASPQNRSPVAWPPKTDNAVLMQTRDVLKADLEPQQLGESLAVHGLLAFCALAVDEHGQTTIADPENAATHEEQRKLRSLRKKQAEFLEGVMHFASVLRRA